MADLGLKTIDDMVGRSDLLELDRDTVPLKAKGIDYSRILYKPDVPDGTPRHCVSKQDSRLDTVLDKELIKMCKDSLTKNKPVKISLNINNTNRATGTMLSGEVCKMCGDGVLLEDTIMCKFKGIAGQSFGAFLAKGVTFELEGMSNDYVGKSIQKSYL